MLFRKKIKEQFMISIPEPCSEDWSKMTVVDEEHRHCDACDRTLTDFSSMNDDELILFFRHSNKKLCGRFRASQLNRALHQLPEVNSPSSKWRAALLIPMSLFGKYGIAQTNDSIIPIDTNSLVINTDSVTSIDSTITDTALVENQNQDSLIASIDSTSIKDSLQAISTRYHPQDTLVSTYRIEETYVYGNMGTWHPEVFPDPPWWRTVAWELPRIFRRSAQSINQPIDGLATENDPSKKPADPIPPTIPDAPWYQAILPNSIRIRKNG